MNKWIKPGAIVGAATVVAALLLLPQAPLGQSGCSLETLSGAYIWSYDGISLDRAAGTENHYAFAGRESYSGDGAMSGMYSGNFEGGEVARNQRYTGTYTVNADCSGTLVTIDEGLTEADALSYDIYIDESTGDFFFTAIDDTEINQGYNRKVN